MLLEPAQYLLGALSGSLVGLSLGLFGGGGSILAVPLMVYVVGVPAPHVAVGTSAFAVAANAAGNLLAHARRGNVIWRCALIYSTAGILGAFVGSGFGKALDGERLLFLFALLMGVVGVLMLRSRGNPARGAPPATARRRRRSWPTAPRPAPFPAFSASAGVSSSCPASSPLQVCRSSTLSAPRSSPSRPSASPPQSVSSLDGASKTRIIVSQAPRQLMSVNSRRSPARSIVSIGCSTSCYCLDGKVERAGA